ncbi:hypothetical protein CVT25_013570 [Psilocybe cyanescens]|uniref:Uncharacterized protein n=1 Tax=Psilocybe cyanescens TaxID=93625 RepID=A0A409XT17_PSICY|nr:hypothetical protein CVT25_013570 [Psilocybe cyanescens]
MYRTCPNPKRCDAKSANSSKCSVTARRPEDPQGQKHRCAQFVKIKQGLSNGWRIRISNMNKEETHPQEMWRRRGDNRPANMNEECDNSLSKENSSFILQNGLSNPFILTGKTDRTPGSLHESEALRGLGLQSKVVQRLMSDVVSPMPRDLQFSRTEKNA